MEEGDHYKVLVFKGFLRYGA